MRTNTFFELIEAITKRLVLVEQNLDQFIANGINPVDWPECPSKKIALEYIAARNKSGHKYALYSHAKNIQNLSDDDSLPTEIQILKVKYHNELSLYRTIELSTSLQSNPKDAEQSIRQYLNKQVNQNELINFCDVIDEIYYKNRESVENGTAIVELLGFEKLSKMISGFNPERVGMLLAQSGFGKTTAAINLSVAACQTMTCVYFNMEMSAQDFGEKLQMSAGEIYYSDYKSKGTNFYATIIQLKERFKGKKLYFSKGKTLSLNEMAAHCRRLKADHDLKFAIVDYDQKIALHIDKHTPEWKALQIAIEQLEALSKELQIFILLLAQEGGEEGKISGSNRSKFPATFVLRFYKDEEQKETYMQAIKNRFGVHNARLVVNYDPAKCKLTESHLSEEIQKKQVVVFGGKKNV
jgi:hypothetical protein